MNVANLQLEGLVMAIAAVNRKLVEAGVLSADDVAHALNLAEASVTSEDRSHDDLSPANRDAICFPIRVLKLANAAPGATPPFSALAKKVGQSKPPYNDQM